MRILRQELRAAAAAVTFLTRVPVALAVDADDMRRAGPYFPLVGAAIGAAGAAVNELTGPELGLAVTTLLTGALHLDALADLADASGASSRERALEIMRDSRIGAFGATALTLDLMVKRAALRRCAPRQLIVCGALSRTVPVVLAARLPYARRDGTAASLAEGGGQRATAALVAGAMCAVAGTRGEGLRLGVMAAGLGLACERLLRRWLDGSTGDALGASLELTETMLLTIAGRR
jgi:adenosylcobinamide-GDP ribazoletransferase